MMFRLFTIFLLTCVTIITVSCGDSKRRTYYDKDYIECIENFPSHIVSHFPGRLTDPALFSYRPGAKEVNKQLHLTLNYRQKTIDSLINTYDKNAIAKYNASDTCLIIVNRFYSGYSNSFKSSLKRPDTCQGEYYPISNFNDDQINTETGFSGLSADYDIYVLKAESKPLSEALSRSVSRNMPDHWKSGFAKGIAVSAEKKKVIFWADIW